jgi:SPP1 gp7 family putative phage head morphogenesis protein
MTLVTAMQEETRKKFVKLFEEDFARQHFEAVGDSVGMDAASVSSQSRILTNALKRKYGQLFNQIATPASVRVMDALNRQSHIASSEAVKDLFEESKHYTLDTKKLDKPTLEILKASTERSAKFIKSIPESYLGHVERAVFNSITNGNGLKDLIPFLEKQGEKTKNWANNTAMDQTRKSYNGLNKGRMQSIGITQGEWIHSGGSQHPRPLHEAFDGKIYNLAEGAPVSDDDGNNVDAGEEPNCRCTFAPVITDDKIDTEEGGENADDE